MISTRKSAVQLELLRFLRTRMRKQKPNLPHFDSMFTFVQFTVKPRKPRNSSLPPSSLSQITLKEFAMTTVCSSPLLLHIEKLKTKIRINMLKVCNIKFFFFLYIFRFDRFFLFQ